MAVFAPLRVPVELRRPGARYFRLADGVSELGMLFSRSLPDELDGPLRLTFYLPEDHEPLHVDALAVDERSGSDEGGTEEGRRRRAVRFHLLDEASRGRIARYVVRRVPVD